MTWQTTTLRKGKQKICRDQFITETKGRFTLCIVKNGGIRERKELSAKEANNQINLHSLVKTQSVFSGCYTWRTEQSINQIETLTVIER